MKSKHDDATKLLWKTRAFLARMEFESAQWRLESTGGAPLNEKSLALYAYDLPTGWTWTCSVPLSQFTETSVRGQGMPGEVQNIRDALAQLMSDVADGELPPSVEGVEWPEQLGQLLSLYAGTTRIWEQAARFQHGGHFIVLNYRKKGSGACLLRPFGSQSPERIIPVDELYASIEQVLALDQAKHPEWFD